jgi:lipopolysaccharide/colanic/teichoic acid biosynthesis glycosyltransferase
MNILQLDDQQELATEGGPSHFALRQARIGIYWHFAVKRTIDIVISAAALVILAPMLVVVSLLIKLESRGPISFQQNRWGKDCKIIKIYKFRSMYVDQCDHSGVAQTVRDDPRVTRVGRVIRRLNIDELPQLVNVLKGDMSLVGPRCHAVGMFAAGVPYEKLVPHYHDRHTMRPGMTGLAQMRGLRGPTDRASKARARVACDIHYVQNFSVWMDVTIIVGTVYSELKGGKGF